MRLDNQTLIEEYYESVKHLYPDVSYEEFRQACITPFLMVRKEMEKGELSTIRLKYFGTFTVYPKRVEGILRKMEKDFKDLRLGPKIYFSKKEMIEKYLKKINNEG